MTTFNISEFKSKVTSLTRQNRFMVNFDATSQSLMEYSNPEKEYLIKTIPLNFQENADITLNWFGLKEKRIGDISIPDLDITFLVDEAFNFRIAMERWFKKANNVIDNTIADGNDIKGDIELNIYSTKNELIKTYRYIGVFPINVQPISLSTAPAEFAECTVTFSVDNWEEV